MHLSDLDEVGVPAATTWSAFVGQLEHRGTQHDRVIRLLVSRAVEQRQALATLGKVHELLRRGKARLLGELGAVLLGEGREVFGVVRLGVGVPRFAQLRARRRILRPEIERRVSLRHPAWPEAIDKHSRAVFGFYGLVHPLDANVHTPILPLFTILLRLWRCGERWAILILAVAAYARDACHAMRRHWKRGRCAMAWFKRRKSRPPRRLPRRELAPVEEIVEQGLLVADVAARMTVKNAIIMNALKRKMDYHREQIREMVQETLTELAEERERDARHIERMRGEIRHTGRSAWSESEYGNDDNRTLRHRQAVYEGVADELRRRVDDPEYINTTADRALAAAWEEIGNSLKDRAMHPYYSGGSSPEYRSERGARIQLLIERDLTELVALHSEQGGAVEAENGDEARTKPKRRFGKSPGKSPR